VVLQRDGRAIIGGVGTVDGQPAFTAARLLSDGQLDPAYGNAGVASFLIGSGAFPDVFALQPDGKLLFAGDTTTSQAVVAVIRLLPDGGLDPTFGTDGVAEIPGRGTNAMALQPDGRIVIAGVGAGVLRLNADGTLDQTGRQAPEAARAWSQSPASCRSR
jgi:uncharacterized delta-60 repeat protein